MLRQECRAEKSAPIRTSSNYLSCREYKVFKNSEHKKPGPPGGTKGIFLHNLPDTGQSGEPLPPPETWMRVTPSWIQSSFPRICTASCCTSHYSVTSRDSLYTALCSVHCNALYDALFTIQQHCTALHFILLCCNAGSGKR